MKILKTKMLIKSCVLLTLLNISFAFLSFKFFLNTTLIFISSYLLFKIFVKFKNINFKKNKFTPIKTSKPNNFLYFLFKNNQNLESNNISQLSYPVDSDHFSNETDISNRFANLLFDPKQLPKNFINYN